MLAVLEVRLKDLFRVLSGEEVEEDSGAGDAVEIFLQDD